MRYRGLVTGAVIALALAAITSLAAARRAPHDRPRLLHFRRPLHQQLLRHADGLAVVLALASAMRYYFVITLGERIVSDLRRDVFAHVTRLSPPSSTSTSPARSSRG
jgi:ATP-binding cassette subfamily B protein